MTRKWFLFYLCKKADIFVIREQVKLRVRLWIATSRSNHDAALPRVSLSGEMKRVSRPRPRTFVRNQGVTGWSSSSMRGQSRWRRRTVLSSTRYDRRLDPPSTRSRTLSCFAVRVSSAAGSRSALVATTTATGTATHLSRPSSPRRRRRSSPWGWIEIATRCTLTITDRIWGGWKT